MRLGVGLALVLSALAMPRVVRADPPSPVSVDAPPKVVLLAEKETDPVVARLRAELESLGFRVVIEIPKTQASSPPSLDTIAHDAGAAAAIRVEPARGGVEVWVLDRVTGKTVSRTVTAGDAPTIAIRAVELLRASLMEVGAQHASRGDVAATREIRAMAEPSTAQAPIIFVPRPHVAPDRKKEEPVAAPEPREPGPFFGAEAATSMLMSPGGLGVEPALDLGAHVMVWPRVGVSFLGLVPLTSVSREGAEGTRSARVAVAATGLRIHLASPTSRWLPSIGGGLAVVWMHVEGTGRAPDFRSSSSDGYAAGPFLRGGISVEVIKYVRFRSDLFAGLAIPRLVIDAAGRDTDTWGRPYFDASLGAEVDVP